MGACDEAFGVSLGETASSADLGGSSKYSNENFEDRTQTTQLLRADLN